MIDRKNAASEYGYSDLIALAVTTLAFSAALAMGAVTTFTPEAWTPGDATESVAANDVPTAYFPAQYVNQATEIEPMPPTF